MKKWLRFPLGVASLAAGGALLAKFGMSTALALTQPGGGVDLPNLYAIGLGLMGVGGAWDLLRPRRAAADKVGVVAKSVFATRRHIDACGISEDRSKPDEGLYLGFFCDDGKQTQLCYRGAKSLLCIGVPGSNKTAGLVIPALQSARRSAIVLDMKLQNAAVTSRKRGTMGRVIILNPYGVLVDELPHLQSHGWNPLLQLDPTSEDFESDAYCIAEAITDSAGANDSSSGRFFSESSLNLAACLVMWERYVHGDKASLCNVRATVCAPNEYADVDGEKRVVGGFLFELEVMRTCEHAAIRNVSTRLYQRLTDAGSHGTSAQDVIDTFMSSTRFLDDPRIARDMKKGGRIDFAALHTEIVTIYIGLPPHQLVAQAKWLRLFINLALAELYKHPPHNPTLPPVLFMLDEFGNVGRLSNIVSAMNIARDYRVQLWMFLQNLGQLKANNYPKEWTSFFSGSGVLTTFNASDTETQQELSKLFGNEEKSVPTETVNGISTGLQAIPIVRPEDLARLGRRGETINLIEPCTMPIRGVAPVYPETPFNVGLESNPYFRG
jgi:type IV secretion system protein VirD4